MRVEVKYIGIFVSLQYNASWCTHWKHHNICLQAKKITLSGVTMRFQFVNIWFLAHLNRRLIRELIIWQGCCLSVCLCVLCSHFQTSSPLEPLGRLKSNFMWSLYGMGERKFAYGVQVTWPRWPPYSYIKPFKNFLHRNRWADLHET